MTDEDEYKKQLGFIGVQMMNLGKQQAAFAEDTHRELRSLSGIGDIGTIETRLTEVDDGVFDPIVDRLRSSTFRVRITNSLGDIVEPLYDRLRIIQGENEEIGFKYHHEDSLYYDKMLDALFNMESKNSSQNRGIYLATKEFMRHPMWNTLRLTLKGLWEVTKFSTNVLFGFGKKKSDTDRIVDAIKEQTQWHMTKSITQQQGFLTRLLQQGIVGMPIRGLMNGLAENFGIGRETAQRNEDARSTGEQVSGVKNFVSDFLYSDSITKKGRLGGLEDESQSLFPLLTDTNKFMEELISLSLRSTLASEAQLEFLYSRTRLDESASRIKLEYQKNTQEEMIELVRDIDTGVYQTAKNAKETQKEVKKHRQQAFWMGFMNIGAKLVTGVLSLGGKIAGMALSLLPMKGIAGLFSKLGMTIVGGIVPKLVALSAILLGKGGNLLSSAKNRIKGGASKAGEIGKAGLKSPTAKGIGAGAVISLGSDFAADKLGRDTKAGAGMDVLGSTAGYASTGALIGSIIPGLGTAIGAAIGGTIGLGKGVWDNRETLFGSTSTEPVQTQAQPSEPQQNSTLPEAGKDILSEINEKTEKSNKIFEEEKKLSNEMVTLLKGILANTRQEDGDLTSPLSGTGSMLLKNYGVK